MTRRVAIVGAGIVGVSTAIWLQRAGHKVTLIDRAGPAEGTSYGNGGILASCAIVPVTVPGLSRKVPRMLFDPDQPLFMRWSYLPRLMPWLVRYLRHANPRDTARIAAALYRIVGDSLADHQALAEGTRAAKWIVPSDYLYAYPSQAAFGADAYGWGLRGEHGFVWDELAADEFHALDPAFGSHLTFAVRMGNHGYISDPGQYVKDLAAHFVDSGGTLSIADVTDVLRDGGAVSGVVANGETIACDAVVLATGIWSGALARKLDVKVPMESERGYHVEFWDAEGGPNFPTMVAAGKFVATPMKGRLRLAGVVELGGLDAPPSRAPFELLKRQAKITFPNLTWSRTSEWMGHRPAPADSIPVIGAVPGVAGAYMGFGHHHVGLTGGPKTGRLLAQLISDQQPNIDLTPYSPARFAIKGRVTT